jgi:hypothetical protein
MADYDYEKQAEATARAFKAHGIGMGATSGGKGLFDSLGPADALTKKFNPLSAAFDGATSATRLTVAAFNAVHSTVSSGIDTWRSLSSSGASFSNDIINMGVSAASSRMSLTDFADVVKNNASGLSFLGGNVTKGAENFAKLSNAMFSADGLRETSDQLRGMGYTSKDLNSILALSISYQRTTLQNTKESQDRAIASAQALAVEMDKNAKLLGISREEQQRVLEQAKLDSAVQARFRMIELTEGPVKAAAAREEYKKGLILATATGTAEMYKDLVANNGVITTEAAANQSALLGKQADGIRDMASATIKGNSDAMKAGMDRTMEGAAENDSNMNILQMRTLGDLNKGVNDTLGKAAISSQTLTDNIRARAEKDNVSLAVARERVLADITKGQQPAKEGGAAITDAAVKMESRLKDVQAGIAQGVARPLTDVVSPYVKRIGDKYLSGNVTDKVRDESKAVTEKFLGVSKTTAPANETTSNAVLRNLRSSGDFVSNIVQPAANTTPAKAEKPTTPAANTTSAADQSKPEVITTRATLDDVLESLKTLNTKMQNMSDHTEAIKDLTGKQIKATRGLSNDRFSQ